jgi:DNA-binding transcriptional LysR family regulator
VRIALRIGNTSDIARAGLAGELDLGFVEGEIEEPKLAIRPVGEDELIIVFAPKLAVEMMGPLPGALAGHPWVAREKGSGTRAAFEAALADFGWPPAAVDIVLELPSNEAIRTAVEAGAGLTILSRLVVGSALAAGTLVAAEAKTSRRRFFLLRHRERWQSRAALAFSDLVEAGIPGQGA